MILDFKGHEILVSGTSKETCLVAIGSVSKAMQISDKIYKCIRDGNNRFPIFTIRAQPSGGKGGRCDRKALRALDLLSLLNDLTPPLGSSKAVLDAVESAKRDLPAVIRCHYDSLPDKTDSDGVNTEAVALSVEQLNAIGKACAEHFFRLANQDKQTMNVQLPFKLVSGQS